MDCQKKLNRKVQILSKYIKKNNLAQRNKKKQIRQAFLGERHNCKFNNDVDWNTKDLYDLKNYPVNYFIFFFFFIIISKRFKKLQLVIQLSVSVNMMTETMHYLPFFGAIPCHQKQIFIEIIFHMYKIMAYSHQSID